MRRSRLGWRARAPLIACALLFGLNVAVALDTPAAPDAQAPDRSQAPPAPAQPPAEGLQKYCLQQVDLISAMEAQLPQDSADALEASIRAAEAGRQTATPAPRTPVAAVAERATQAAPVYSALRGAARVHREEAVKALALAEKETDPAMRAFRMREAASRIESAQNALQRASAIATAAPAPAGGTPIAIDDSGALRQLRVMAQGETPAQMGFENSRSKAGGGERPGGTPLFQGDPPAVYDARKQQLQLHSGAQVDLTPLARAMAEVDPALAREPLLVPDPQLGGALRPSQALRALLADPNTGARLREVGGVDLEVTFDFLSLARVSDFRGPRTSLQRPVMLSLRNLLEQAAAHTADAAAWRALPERLRYPGDMARIHGFVLDPAGEDVLLIATPALRREERLDIDSLILGLRAVWLHGESPAVSLDPLPDDPAGPQYPRVMGVPLDSSFARVLLDADYMMKRIMLGATPTGIEGYRNALDLLEQAPTHAGASRFWFYPRPLGPHSVQVSSSARSVLFDSGLTVLSESQRVESGVLVDSGERDEQAQQAAAEFNTWFEHFQRAEFVAPRGVFVRLHGLLDVVTAARLLRAFGVDTPVLHAFAQLPYRKLQGEEAVPAYYPGVHLRRASGRYELTVSGGVHLRARPAARSLDRYQDPVAAALEALAGRFPRDAVAQPVGFDFTIASLGGQLPLAERELRQGNLAMTARDYRAARSHLTRAVEADPLAAQAWGQLALAYAATDNTPQALAAARRAALLEPADPVLRLLALDLEWRTDPAGMQARTSAPERRRLSEEYVAAADMALGDQQRDQAQRLVQRAIRLWDGNGEAHLLHAATRAPEDSAGQRVDTARAIRAYRKALADEATEQARQRLAFALSQSALQRVTRASGVMAAASQRADQSFDALMVGNDLDSAAREAEQARALQPELPLAIAIEVMARALRTEVLRAADLRGDFGNVRALADRAVARHPDFPLVYVARAILRVLEQQTDTALADAQRALDLDPTSGLGYLIRATVHSERGACRAAIADLQQARRYRIPIAESDAQFLECSAG